MSARRKILRAINREARYIGDPHARRVFKKAAVETGIVESGLTNPSGGTSDSAGWRQERASLYPNPTNINAAARRFRQEFQQHYQPGEKSYQVAADVQRPAAQYRGRYKDVAAQASAVLKGSPNSGSSPSNATGPSYSTTTIPGVDRSAERTQAKLAYLDDRHNPDALLNLASSLKDSQDTPSSTKRVRLPNQAPTGTSLGPQQSTGGNKVTRFDGKPVPAWIARDLKRARAAGWKGSVTSGVRSKSQQMAAAKRFGLQHYGPKGPLGSNHVAGHDGAVDVTDPDGLARALKKIGSPLHRGMADDPVHFSRSGH